MITNLMIKKILFVLVILQIELKCNNSKTIIMKNNNIKNSHFNKKLYV